MEDLRITLVQSDIVWEEPGPNHDHFEKTVMGIREPTDLILLPETFATGFSINPGKVAEPAGGPSAMLLKKLAQKKKCAVAGTIITREGKKVFNRLSVYFPDGSSATYDKRHLFRLSEEYKLFSQGNEKIIITIKGWNILPLVCYDLRFPVWSKNTWEDGKYGYDLMLYLSNWPDSRSHIWKTLLTARAIENQAYAVGVNRIGNDGHGTWHSGQSLVAGPKGNILLEGPSGKAMIKTIRLSASDLEVYRESFTAGMDWDKFTIRK
jgi:omega-amidase